MTEVILFNIVEKILCNLGSDVLQQIGLAWGVTEELRKLENKMSTIKNVLLDAEEQQVRNHAVRGWLQRLKDVVYDADDLMDDVATEGLRRQVEIHGSKTREVRYFFTRSNPLKFHFGIGRKIKDIRERLDEIVADMRDFTFVVRVGDGGVETRAREETYSYVRSSEVIGRDSDKEAIMKQLLEHSSDKEKNIVVIPIVGMGGLGKTTLARLVYNDERVAQFDPRLWVCASNVNHLRDIMEKIIKAATSATDCDKLEIEQLQSHLREILGDRKFLLVLDDVWIEDRVVWVNLRDLLMVGASGSKIVLTTRSKTVASIMGTYPSYDLKGLPQEDCLSLFLKWAFSEGQETEHQDLVSIGNDIVRKCGGVPLAARTLGGLLYSKTNIKDWLFVRDNEIWALEQKENDILPALRLSYDHMPSYLKQCFAYCSLFRKHEVILKHQLILHWMAQGFIKSLDSNELEDIGEWYFNELVSRSFFQDVEEYYEADITTFTMHDLVYDLAQSVAGMECSRVNFSTCVSEKVRHVSFDQSTFPWTFLKTLLKEKKLRTIFKTYDLQRFAIEPTDKLFLHTLFSSFRHLRVLDFQYLLFEELPNSIGNLKHLRYLEINRNYRLTKLPNSICKLQNLQTLNLFLCIGLQELPRDFGKLINLRNFHLSSYLTHLPEKGIGGLTSLRELLIAKSYELTSMSEGIQYVTALRKLYIFECPKLTSLPSGMRCLTALEKLRISMCPELTFVEEDLQGLRSLQTLKLDHLPRLVTLPKGLQDAATTLQILHIHDCPGLTTLPEYLGNFTSLRSIMISLCPNLLSLPEGMHRLTALRSLAFNLCPHLSRRCEMDIGEDWPKIAHVPEIQIR